MFNLKKLVKNYRQQKMDGVEVILGQVYLYERRLVGIDTLRVLTGSWYNALSKDFTEEELQTARLAKELVVEISQAIKQLHKKGGSRNFGGETEKIRQLLTKLKEEELPSLIEKALKKTLLEAGVDLS